MKKYLAILVAVLSLFFTMGCGNTASNDAKPAARTGEAATANQQKQDFSGKKILVAYFSRADENTGGVGVITEGNTKILADMVAKDTGGTLFEIKPVNPYPKEYKAATDVAKKEQAEGARPEIEGPLPDLKDYDVIFLGYPIWWGDLPMPVYTFLDREGKDAWKGKTIIPFATHEGSGLGETPDHIAETTGASVLNGLEMQGHVAQKERDTAQKAVTDWLKGLGFSK